MISATKLFLIFFGLGIQELLFLGFFIQLHLSFEVYDHFYT
jgi:hypothetical protein